MNGTNVLACLLADACKGERGGHDWTDSISTETYLEETRYCETGYRGPYCAVCANGYRRISGYECLDCQSKWGVVAHVVLWLVVALTPVLLVSLMLYLFGGTTSFKQARSIIFISLFVTLLFPFYVLGASLSINRCYRPLDITVASHFLREQAEDFILQTTFCLLLHTRRVSPTGCLFSFTKYHDLIIALPSPPPLYIALYMDVYLNAYPKHASLCQLIV